MTATRKPVPGWPGYEADSDGLIWSARTFQGRVGTTWRQLKGYIDKDGYRTVALNYRGRKKTTRVAHLVLEAFHGPRPKGAESAHFPDPSPANNRAENLRWATHRENIADKVALSRQARGEGHAHAKLTEESVRQIRAERSAGARFCDLSRKHGVSSNQIILICERRNWRHVA